MIVRKVPLTGILPQSKKRPLKIISKKHDFYLIQPYSSLDKIWMNALTNTIYGEHFVFTPKIFA